MKEILSLLENSPVIAAVRRPEDLSRAIASPSEVIFLLCGDILNVFDMVDRVKAAGKGVFIHMELLGGIGKDSRAVDFIAEKAAPHGIISTRSQTIRRGREKGLFTIQRFFVVDSLSYSTMVDTIRTVHPHMAEVMPGILPGILKKLKSETKTGIIAGGLVETKEDVLALLSAGASNVSTSRQELWSV